MRDAQVPTVSKVIQKFDYGLTNGNMGTKAESFSIRLVLVFHHMFFIVCRLELYTFFKPYNLLAIVLEDIYEFVSVKLNFPQIHHPKMGSVKSSKRL